MEKKIMAIYRNIVDEIGMFIGQDVWLTDGVDTYYVGMNTGVLGPYGSSTGYFQYFSTTYDLYDVADELFGYIGDDARIVSITLT